MAEGIAEPLNSADELIEIVPSAPIEEEPPNYADIPPQQQPYNPPQQHIVDDEKQPLYSPDANVPLDNMITPSQDQIAAVLPSFDNAPSQSNKAGVGYIAGCKESPNIITWILTISMWTLLILGIIWMHTLLIIAAVLYVISLIETGCSAIHNYLSNILQNEGAEEYIQRMKSTPIQIWWKVRCYHYETRTRVVHTTDKDGHRRTRHETHREKVYTWRAEQQYYYNVCVDISGDILGLDEYELTRLRIHKAYEFANDATRQNYINEQERFKRNNWRDAHQEFDEENKIDGFVSRILAEREPGIKPKWMDLSFFWLFSVIAFSPCYRQKLVARCGNIDFALIKQISC